jgi:iron-sulfur cluster repair protein YtfE (RIC family)
MSIANHLHRFNRFSVPNTHSVPQPFSGARKDPQRAMGIVGAGEVVQPSDSRSNVPGTPVRHVEFPLDILINRLIQDQHAEIRRELLRLQEISAEAIKDEIVAKGKMRAVAQLLGSLVTAIVAHMNEEEEVFPSLLKLELAYIGEGNAPTNHTLARGALREFSKDHTEHFKSLEAINRRAESITTAANLTPTEHDLPARLKTLHRLLLKHCFFETNIVFARAAQMEAELFR